MTSESTLPEARSAGRRQVLLVGWDGADWKMIDPLLEQGQMPNLQRLIDGGVMGNIASLAPMLSPILWTSIATGKCADKHGILGFAEPDGTTGKVRPVTSTSRKCKAVWNVLSERGLKVGVVNWFASQPAEEVNGYIVTDRFPQAVGPPDKEWPPVAGSVHPENLLEELCKLRVHPARTTAKQVAPFIPKLAELEPREDKNLHQLRVLLAQCASVHNAATWLMHEKEWDFFAIYYDTIDRFAHTFMEYHPPKMEHVSDQDFERYQEVVTGCYRFHDMMLGALLELADDNTTVILLSDHGFHSDDLRPKGSSKIKEGRPVAWHRPYGILVISGPDVRKDQRVYGASLLDIAPTVLATLGCPVARDMDGKPLVQVFEQPPAVSEVETFETPGGRAQAAETVDDPWVARQMLQRLVELGYIESDESVEGVFLDRTRNLGQVYAAAGRHGEALEQFQRVLDKKPDDKGCQIAIGSCLLDLGRLDECEAIVKRALTDNEDASQANCFLGMISFRRGDTATALKHLRRAEKGDPRLPGLHSRIGHVYLARQRWVDAQRAFQKALSIDPDDAISHDGLGVAYRRQKRPAEAVKEHMESIARLHYRPQTHIHLGLALAEAGRMRWAARAFNVALEMNPNNPLPHRCLAELYERALKDKAKAAEHRRKADELRAAAKD